MSEHAHHFKSQERESVSSGYSVEATSRAWAESQSSTPNFPRCIMHVTENYSLFSFVAKNSQLNFIIGHSHDYYS